MSRNYEGMEELIKEIKRSYDYINIVDWSRGTKERISYILLDEISIDTMIFIKVLEDIAREFVATLRIEDREYFHLSKIEQRDENGLKVKLLFDNKMGAININKMFYYILSKIKKD